MNDYGYSYDNSINRKPETTSQDVVYTVLVKKNKLVDFFQFKKCSDAMEFAKYVQRAAEVTNIEVNKITTQIVKERLA